MSLESALTVAMSGIRASSLQLELTASNISNASVEGYSRKSAVTTSATLGSVAGGTEVSGFTRSENKALFTTLTTATTNAGLRATQNEYQQRVQDILGTSNGDDPKISQYVTSFVNSWTQLQSTPESLVSQRQVVQNAINMSDEVQRLAAEVEAADRECYADINSSLSDLNAYLVQIRDLNERISVANNSKLSPGNLQDQRDQLVLKVAEFTGLTILERPFGQVALFTSTGYQLVDGSSLRSFIYDGTDITSSANPGLSLNTAMIGGRLEALTNFRATTTPVSTDPGTSVIQKLRDQLDTIADAFLTNATTATSGELSFASAYESVAATGTELNTDFFVGVDRTTFAVNASLIDGTASVKSSASSNVVDALLDATRVFSADGLSVTGGAYTSLVTTSLTSFQQAATNLSTLSETAESSRAYLEEKHANETAVNVDNELVSLVNFQNAYSASAHAMSVIKELFQKLEALL